MREASVVGLHAQQFRCTARSKELAAGLRQRGNYVLSLEAFQFVARQRS